MNQNIAPLGQGLVDFAKARCCNCRVIHHQRVVQITKTRLPELLRDGERMKDDFRWSMNR